jgi:hypothetical protein
MEIFSNLFGYASAQIDIPNVSRETVATLHALFCHEFTTEYSQYLAARQQNYRTLPNGKGDGILQPWKR